ncbi:MAG: hypothetical protein AB7G93_13490 [Bdellovibrionales bacterium]
MATTKSNPNLSFRPLLVRSVRHVLSELRWKDPGLDEAVTEILTGLAKHKEEGKRLYPTVFLSHDLTELLSCLGGADPLLLGSGRLEAETVNRALKQCAPLSEGRSWFMFILIESPQAKFGVFRAPSSPIEPTSFERLRALETDRPTILGIVQLAENILEIRGSSEFHRYFHLSGASPSATQPMSVTREFIRALVHDVPPDLQKAMGNLYYRVLMDVMQTWHGTLAVVLRKGAEIPTVFHDGVYLEPPLDVAQYVKRFIDEAEFRRGTNLQAQINLIRGMLGADGILVFRSDGALLGYHVFVRPDGQVELPFQAIGGARRRAFEVLKRLVGREVLAAFYRSQDGNATCTSIF